MFYVELFFFETLFLRRLYTDFLETLPHDLGSSATENVPATLVRCLLKIRGQFEVFGV